MRRPQWTLAPLALLATLLVGADVARAEIGVAPARGFVPHQLIVKFEGDRSGRTITLPRGVSVRRTAAQLRRNDAVLYAEPNYIATASAFVVPNDPGTLTGAAEAASAGDWSFKQWNFLAWQPGAGGRLPTSPGGIDAVGAWRNLEAVGRPGGLGVTVAVLDTGIAYRKDGKKFLRSPDFAADQFAKGHDFVDGDKLPLDENGHGTHVAGTIAERTDNGVGLTGIAYSAKLMPIRVLDQRGRGDAVTIAKGIRFAIGWDADVINMSFNFGCGKRVPEVDEALREAYAEGIVTVASAGNLGSESCISPPATGPRVIGVGGTTEGGCLGNYSLSGGEIDLVAPGGGAPASGCPSVSARPIYQVTLKPGTTNVFGIPGNYVGTSMAAAHVAGAAALVIAAETHGGPSFIPKLPKKEGKIRVNAVARWLRKTARDLGLPGTQQGAGLIDVGAATLPRAVPEGG